MVPNRATHHISYYRIIFEQLLFRDDNCSLHTYHFNKGKSCNKSMNEFGQGLVDCRPATIQTAKNFFRNLMFVESYQYNWKM